MESIELSYLPFKTDEQGNIDEKNYTRYLTQPSLIKIVEEMVISPFEESLKRRNKTEFEFSDFTVKRSIQKRKNTSWKKVYTSLLSFLTIRAQDSRAYETEEFRHFDGIGYCISIDELEKETRNRIEQQTSISEFPILYWPRRKKGERIRDIIIPDTDFRKINTENARICLSAKRFCKSLEEEVITAYKNANSSWMEKETGYSKEKIPPRELSPIRRTRKIARGKYIFILHAREETPLYRDIITSLLSDLAHIKNGETLRAYKQTRFRRKRFVNITSILNRISIENIYENPELFEKFIRLESRYEITP